MRIIKILILSVMFFLIACSHEQKANKKLAAEILANNTMIKVDSMARALMKKGFYAGSGYQMVWARDLNTFIELSCEEYDLEIIRENLLMFFHFQRENGELLDGYVPMEGFTWNDPKPYYSKTATGHVGFKNTVETDQETSLIQAIYKYIQKTGDRSILEEEVAAITVWDRIFKAYVFLIKERYYSIHGLIIGATTFDWGDVQVEGGAVVDVDSLTHWSMDVYDNAMLAIALRNLAELAIENDEKEALEHMAKQTISRIRMHLWDSQNKKFIPHRYINGNSPFPDSFDENKIHFHGGTAVAIEAGVLNKEEISAVMEQMKKNVKLSGAHSIGLTLYPPYPENVLGENISRPYEYQNGGDWTWFGGRMIQQFIANGFVEEAYELAQPMFNRVIENDGFYEWYKIDGTPAGSGDFKGSAGVLAKSIEMFYEWANENSQEK